MMGVINAGKSDGLSLLEYQSTEMPVAYDFSSPYSSKFPKLNILYVDDDDLLRSVVGDLILALGHRADSASSVPHALEKIHTRCYDLVITDLQMFGANGTVLISEIKRFHSEMRVVLVSGCDEGTIMEELKNCAYPDLIIQKPFGLKELAEAFSLVKVA